MLSAIQPQLICLFALANPNPKVSDLSHPWSQTSVTVAPREFHSDEIWYFYIQYISRIFLYSIMLMLTGVLTKNIHVKHSLKFLIDEVNIFTPQMMKKDTEVLCCFFTLL